MAVRNPKIHVVPNMHSKEADALIHPAIRSSLFAPTFSLTLEVITTRSAIIRTTVLMAIISVMGATNVQMVGVSMSIQQLNLAVLSFLFHRRTIFQFRSPTTGGTSWG